MKRILLALVLMCGCKEQPPAPQTILGQAFVTLNNRETIKLSLVPIHVVPAESALEAALRMTDVTQEEKILKEIEQAKSAASEVQSRYDQADRNVRSLLYEAEEKESKMNAVSQEAQAAVNEITAERRTTPAEKSKIALINARIVNLKQIV